MAALSPSFSFTADDASHRIEWDQDKPKTKIYYVGSPIKRPSVKENTSPGEETTIVSLLRYGRVAYSLGQSLFFAFACIQVVSMDPALQIFMALVIGVTQDSYKACNVITTGWACCPYFDMPLANWSRVERGIAGRAGPARRCAMMHLYPESLFTHPDLALSALPFTCR